MKDVDTKYMHRCIELAKKGMGNVAPNPMVGCVIVNKGVIIGEGFHEVFGGAHAEVNAINSVEEKAELKTATLFVNLEPCAHYGKTPPCTELIIESRIPEVVVGCKDPSDKVSGKGIKRLEKAGCKLIIDFLNEEARELNRRFITFHEKGRPYIVLKWAQTRDNYISNIPEDGRIRDRDFYSKNRDANWITNKFSTSLVHKWRSEEQAIMIGRKTAFFDNPRLNVREWDGKDPIRIVLDRSLNLPASLNLFDGSSPTLIFADQKEKHGDAFDNTKMNTEYIGIDFKGDVIGQVLEELKNRDIQSLIIEGGRVLLESFIDNNLWDEARVFVGSKKFNSGVKAPEIHDGHVAEMVIDSDKLLIYRNRA